MSKRLVNCSICKKKYLQEIRHINENKKLEHKLYCSPLCFSKFKNKQKEYSCENKRCNNKFMRAPGGVSTHNFCSHRCAAMVTNTYRSKPARVLKLCNTCSKVLIKNQIKYCSKECFQKGYWGKYTSIYSPELVLETIKKFVSKNKRLPVKKELNKYYQSARRYFGTWNNAIKAAGFRPNPVLFANHHVANDGHKCDSLAERIIDDYLFRKKIYHERNIYYPGGIYTVDFKIGDKWVEYFGLAGEHKRYDQLRKIKVKLAKKFRLDLVEIYPKDLYSKEGLEKFFFI